MLTKDLNIPVICGGIVGFGIGLWVGTAVTLRVVLNNVSRV